MAEQLWWEASIWILLALVSSLLSLKIGISVALVEIIVGIIAGNTIHPNITPWVKSYLHTS
jgi:Kef-type K+ transport system membrane component KefB